MTSRVPSIPNSKFAEVCNTILAALNELSRPLIFDEIYRATELDKHGLSERWIHHILAVLELWENVTISGIPRNRNYTVTSTSRRFVNLFASPDIYLRSLVLPAILDIKK